MRSCSYNKILDEVDIKQKKYYGYMTKLCGKIQYIICQIRNSGWMSNVILQVLKKRLEVGEEQWERN